MLGSIGDHGSMARAGINRDLSFRTEGCLQGGHGRDHDPKSKGASQSLTRSSSWAQPRPVLPRFHLQPHLSLPLPPLMPLRHPRLDPLLEVTATETGQPEDEGVPRLG